MMAYHFIAVSSSYLEGYRIGWHYATEGKLDKNVIRDFMQRVEDECGSLQLGIHKLSTESTSWKSVVSKDTFFEDVIITKDSEQFIMQLSRGKELSVHDIAEFILSLTPISHLKLQKLLYYAYAEYLLKTGKKLFKEPIVAYKYGPVVEVVFKKYKKFGSSIIDYKEDEKFRLTADEIVCMPSFTRIVSSEAGIRVVDCVLEVLNKYGELSAGELVDKTHIQYGPWDRVFRPGRNSLIKDELIVRYHEIVR